MVPQLRKDVLKLAWCTWQDVVRTSWEQDIEIPIYEIPLGKRVRA